MTTNRKTTPKADTMRPVKTQPKLSATPEMAGWKPTDLPQWVAGLAGAHGITVVDATPALAAEARRGVLPYNAIFDTHLNPAGHRAVAKTLADAMRDAPAP